MDEYVLKEDILKYLEKKSSIEISNNSVIGKDISRAIDVLYCDIDNMTPADVQPTKHGTWRKDEQGYDIYVECSECGLNLSISNYIENEWRETLKYCPTCGARMDGDSE